MRTQYLICFMFINYLFMSAFEHNCKGAVANQVLPAELKFPDRLHGWQ